MFYIFAIETSIRLWQRFQCLIFRNMIKLQINLNSRFELLARSLFSCFKMNFNFSRMLNTKDLKESFNYLKLLNKEFYSNCIQNSIN